MKVLGTGFLALTNIGLISLGSDLAIIFLGDDFGVGVDSVLGIKSSKKDLIFCSSFSKTSVLLFL